MANFLIGVDGGGTGTRTALADRSGRILGRGSAGPGGLALGVTAAWQQIQLAIQAAMDDAGLHLAAADCRLGLGLAGANHAPWAEAFRAAAPDYAELVLETDGFIALRAAHHARPGILLAAGTGSVAEAVLANGTRVSAGGWGFPTGDEGGGAWLGLRAIALTQAALDGRRPHGALTRAVSAQCGATRPSLLAWCTNAGQGAFASLAPLIFDAAERDPAARSLLSAAGEAMAELASALDPDASLPVAIAGSVGVRLLAWLPAALRPRCSEASEEPVFGALSLVLGSVEVAS